VGSGDNRTGWELAREQGHAIGTRLGRSLSWQPPAGDDPRELAERIARQQG
jgi:hypothetical protein